MFSWLTQTTLGKIVATFIISMLPVVELRGADGDDRESFADTVYTASFG